MTSSNSSLIINSPTGRPNRHWVVGEDTHLKEVIGRRPASFESIDPITGGRREFLLDPVNQIRVEVDEWRRKGYPGVTHITECLLSHWVDENEQRAHPLYFCQMEAIETLIWCVEVANDLDSRITCDGGNWKRLCCKMATGSGKTVVMAMIVVWQTLNALAFPRNEVFCKNFLMVAPGLTVRKRLEVLKPSASSIYDEFDLAPREFRQNVNSANVTVINKHKLHPSDATSKYSVDKRGPRSSYAMVREILGNHKQKGGIVIINDEAHHAYRVSGDQGIADDDATKWIEGLDKVHDICGIRQCFDMTATPFVSSGSMAPEKTLFKWIVSDFGLYDAIEAGLVKTPYMVVEDDGLPDSSSMQSKLSRIYHEQEVMESLNRSTEPQEALPELVRSAYNLLGTSWEKVKESWKEVNHYSPPVMLTVCNSMSTAARIEYYFENRQALARGLSVPEAILRVDSEVLGRAEADGQKRTTRRKDKGYEEKLNKIIDSVGFNDKDKQNILSNGYAEVLREIVDTVGKKGKPGQNIQNVISVMMLSEGWDANNVTHIMGLRAFSSQLLCEQVIGRGLRRVSHDKDENGFLLPEYVEVFGIPISLISLEKENDKRKYRVPSPNVKIEALSGRRHLEITWPNVKRIESVIRPYISIDWKNVTKLKIDPSKTPISADLAPAVSGAHHVDMIKDIDLTKFPEDFRIQREIFKSVVNILSDIKDCFEPGMCKCTNHDLAIQMLKIVEVFVDSRLDIPSSFNNSEIKRVILIALNSDRITRHVAGFVKGQNRKRSLLTFEDKAIESATGDMVSFPASASKIVDTRKSHINYAYVDSTWEARVIRDLEKHPKVLSYVKNHRIGFWIWYLYEGRWRKYYPDFLIKLDNEVTLVLEVTGQFDDVKEAKKLARDEWVYAVNQDGNWGIWTHDEIYSKDDTHAVIDRALDIQS